MLYTVTLPTRLKAAALPPRAKPAPQIDAMQRDEALMPSGTSDSAVRLDDVLPVSTPPPQAIPKRQVSWELRRLSGEKRPASPPAREDIDTLADALEMLRDARREPGKRGKQNG